jgi:dTDP-4-amino-4,6-dideoxygalactose transaminase
MSGIPSGTTPQSSVGSGSGPEWARSRAASRNRIKPPATWNDMVEAGKLIATQVDEKGNELTEHEVPFKMAMMLPAFKGVDFRVHGDLTHTDKIMNDAFWIGVWPGIDAARRDYIVSVLVDLVRGE